MDGAGAPIANETVRISLEGGQETNYTTNEEGKAQIDLTRKIWKLDKLVKDLSELGEAIHVVAD